MICVCVVCGDVCLCVRFCGVWWWCVWEGCMVMVYGRVVWWWCLLEGCMVVVCVGGLYGGCVCVGGLYGGVCVWEGWMVMVYGRVVWWCVCGRVGW